MKKHCLILLILILLVSLTLQHEPDSEILNNQELVWNMDADFDHGDKYWYRRVGEWGLSGNYQDLNFTDLNFVAFEKSNNETIVHLSVNRDPDTIEGYTTVIATITQGWIWDDNSKAFQPDPLHLSAVKELYLKTLLLNATCEGVEAAVLINVWFLLRDVSVLRSFHWVRYEKAILGLDIYLKHVNTPLLDYQLRETVSSNGTLVYVFTRYIDNGTGTYEIDLLRELNNAVKVALNNGIIIDLKKASLIQVEAVVDEFYGYSEANFSYLKVIYSTQSKDHYESRNLKPLIQIELMILSNETIPKELGLSPEFLE